MLSKYNKNQIQAVSESSTSRLNLKAEVLSELIKPGNVIRGDTVVISNSNQVTSNVSSLKFTRNTKIAADLVRLGFLQIVHSVSPDAV